MRSSSFLSFIAVFAAHYPVVNAAAIASAEIDGNETSTLVARDDGFKYSCDGIGFVPQFRSLLFATCRRADGTVGGNTQINLDKCVGNNDGQLVAQANGGLWGSCDKDSCSVWNAILKCNCRKYGGEWESSVLDLNWFMGNDNGALTCFGLKGL